MVLAGAGSGKTRVLTCRIAWLVERGVEPRRILAVTFTNKAAGEMRERMQHLLRALRPAGGEAERSPLNAAMRAMWIGPFHAVCARLLRIHGARIGLARDFAIFDDDDQKRLVTAILRELNVSDKITPRAVLSRIDRARNPGDDPTQLFARDYVAHALPRAHPL